jgi:organic radical activating enzyme
LVETFYSLQGEGFYCGAPAYFIRLAGCDVGCTWCDSKNSWNIKSHPLVSVGNIVAQARQTAARRVVVTGGEPLLHDLTPLCNALKNTNLLLHLETSGTQPLSGVWDWIALSPKRQKPPLDAVLQQADELKVVICNELDIVWAEANATRCRPQCHLFLQPEWDNSHTVLPLIINYAKQHPQWRVSLQMHKFIGMQ